MAKMKNGKDFGAVAMIGTRLQEGKLTTIIFGFDKNKNPIRVPEGVFVGESGFDNQDRTVAQANGKLGLKGQKALTRLSDQECAQLARVWNEVASPAQRGSAAPQFWGASKLYNYGRFYRGGEVDWGHDNRYDPLRPVPAALRGPVRG